MTLDGIEANPYSEPEEYERQKATVLARLAALARRLSARRP